jgi:hypothetical protein
MSAEMRNTDIPHINVVANSRVGAPRSDVT